MNPADQLALGLDFGTESVRALLVDLTGRERGIATCKYRHGQILEALPGSSVKLPPDYALQHPGDWIEAAAPATREALVGPGATVAVTESPIFSTQGRLERVEIASF